MQNYLISFHEMDRGLG